MNGFDVALGWLVAHGPTLLLGTTLVLLGGVLAMLAHRSPAQRRRLGMLTALGTLGYLFVGTLPLPRFPLGGGLEAVSGPALEGMDLESVVDPDARAAALRRALEHDLGPTNTSRDEERSPTHAALGAIPGSPLPTAASPADTIAWPELLTISYLGGAFFWLLRYLVGVLRLRALLATCVQAPPTALFGVALPTGTRVLLAPTCIRPFCAGLVRPVIVLPRELQAPERSAEAIAVLRHEAAHLRTGDTRAQALLALLAIPLFCHPLFWWLCREVRFNSELLADDCAARTDGRHAYARALLTLAERDQPELAAAGAVAVFHRPSEFYRRIQMLLQRQGSLSTSTTRARKAAHALATMFLVGTVAGLFGVPASAQDPPARRERKETVELRETIATLRAEVEALRAYVQTLQTAPLADEQGQAPPSSSVVTDLLKRAETNRGVADLFDRLNKPQPAGTSPDTEARVLELLQQRGFRAAKPQPPLSPTDSYAKMKKDFADLGKAFETAKEGQPVDAPPMSPFSGFDLFERSVDRNGQDVAKTRNTMPNSPSAGTAATATEELTSRYLDLQADIEIAEVTAADTRQLAEAGGTPQLEARKAAVNLRTLQKKLAIVQRLLDGEITATETELEWLERTVQQTDVRDRAQLVMQRERARTRLEALRAVK